MRLRLPGLLLAGSLTLAGAAALAQAEAERRLDAALDRLRDALGPETRLEIGARQVDPVTGAARLNDVVVVQGARRLTLPEVRLQDVGPMRIGRAEFAAPRLQEGDAGMSEAGRVLIAGLPLPPEGQSLDLNNLTFDALEVEGLRMQNRDRGALQLGRISLNGWTPDAIAGGSLEGLDYRSADKRPQVLRLGRARLEALVLPRSQGEFDPQVFRAGLLSLEGAELEAPQQQVSLRLGRVLLRDWVPGRLTELAVEGLNLVSPAQSYGMADVTLGRFSASGMDAATMLSALMEERQVPDPRPGVTQSIAAEGLAVSLDGAPLFDLGRLAMQGALEGGIGRGSLLAEGLRIVPPAGSGAWLDSLGYSAIAGRVESSASLPRNGGTLEVAPLSLTWDDAASLTLTARVAEMPGSPPEGAPLDSDAMMARYAAAQLAGASLAWRDHGLIGRLVAQQARQQRQPEPRIREQWAQMALSMPLPGERPAARRNAPPAKGGGAPTDATDAFASIRQALASFIRQPGTLEITLAPPQPIRFLEFGSLAGTAPGQIVQRLGLTVTAR